MVGRLGDASNAVFLVALPAGHGIYKPIRGERPLWDFPDGCLAQREVAAYLISSAGGWDLVPATVLRDGPYGPGSVQHWVTEPPYDEGAPRDGSGPEPGDPPGTDLGEAGTEPGEPGTERGEARGDPPEGTSAAIAPDIVVAALGTVPPGYLPVLSGRLPDGTPVQVAHADTDELAAMAVLDAVLNNSDRKGSHVLRDPSGGLWGVDHGVSLHVEAKLRTVLWGWEGQAIREADLARLERLAESLGGSRSTLAKDLAALLTAAEIAALADRVETLRDTGSYPHPPQGWPSVPWPAL